MLLNNIKLFYTLIIMDFTISKRKKEYNAVNKYINSSQKKNQPLLRSLKLGKTLGEGAQGIVFKSTFKTPKQKFPKNLVVKRTLLTKNTFKLKSNLFSSKALKTESYIEIVSSMLVNQLILQKICPNYTLNYDADILDNCTKEKISYRKYCTVQYNEFCNYGNFSQWITKHRGINLWCNALFQIMAGLYAMKSHYNMIHNDLHGKNILVQKVKKGGYWVYKIDNKKYYVPNLGYIFLISDFGFSWIPGVMYPRWLIKKRKNYYSLQDSNYTRLNKKSMNTWDLSKLKRVTIDPNVKNDAKINKHFKNTFLTLFDHVIKYVETDFPKDDLIKIIYGSGSGNCNKYPFYCYTNKNLVEGEKIETYDLDKKLNKKSIKKDIKTFICK